MFKSMHKLWEVQSFSKWSTDPGSGWRSQKNLVMRPGGIRMRLSWTLCLRDNFNLLSFWVVELLVGKSWLCSFQKKVVEQLRKELLVKQEPEAKLQLQVQAPPVGGEMKPMNLLQSQQITGGLQQVRDAKHRWHSWDFVFDTKKLTPVVYKF